MKPQELIKKTTLLFQWEKRGLSETLNFVKLGLIIILCALQFNISAQQTQLQKDIENATTKTGIVKRGSIEWFVVRKTTINGVNYAFLISKTPILSPYAFDSSNTNNSDYRGSTLQTGLNTDYANYSTNYGEFWPIAVVPDLNLAAYTSQSVTSEPTAVLAGDQRTNILFAPSYKDVTDWCGLGGVSIGSPVTDSYFARWWTRTASLGQVWDVFPAGPVLELASSPAAVNINAVGGIWVRTSPLYCGISGMVNGSLNNNEGIEISYSIDGVTQPYVTTTTGGAYSIVQIPFGSNVILTPQDIPGYKWYVWPTPDISNLIVDVSKKFITYYVPGFTINDDNYLDVDGKQYCENTFTFKADPNIPAEIIWRLDGTEIPSTHSLSSFTQTLGDGYHTIEMEISTLGEIYTTHLYVGNLSVIWTPGANSTAATEDDKRNWNIAANWTPAIVPTSCDTVFIPGNLAYYPMLEDANPAECLDIYFLFGAELGRPDLLTYQRAFVQYNFGLLQSIQKTSPNLKSNSTDDRMAYSASASATHLIRERWYMLAAPLKSVVTGDLEFGDFPLTFLRKFGPVNKDNIQYPVGVWTTPYNSMKEPVAPTGTEGFAFFMYGYLDGGSATRNIGCKELGSFGDYNENDYMPNRSGKSYGIEKTNGILELPFFTDSTSLYAHRTQVYDQPSSTFYYVNDGVNYPSEINKLSGTTESVTREPYNGNYRFVPESYNGTKWVFQNPMTYPVGDLHAGEEFLAANPYMSSIDISEFCIENSSVEPYFRIWNGDDFDTYTVDTSTGEVSPTNPGSSPYIAPLQGFLLTYTGSGIVSFDVKKISTVRKTTEFNLRSDQGTVENDLLRIKAENSYAASYSVIKYKEGANNGYKAGEDVPKLFSPFDEVPSVYSLADETPVDFNFINGNGNITIPIGIKTEQTGETRLSFTGMDNYTKASKIEFIDAIGNKTIDLTGKSNYTYTFNNTETGILNGRFSLRLSNSETALTDINSLDDLKIFGNAKTIYVISSEPVQKLEIYDFSGRKLYESNSDARYYPLQTNLFNSPVIVKVMTKSKVKTVKINP